jgi:hypothetical protein
MLLVYNQSRVTVSLRAFSLVKCARPCNPSGFLLWIIEYITILLLNEASSESAESQLHCCRRYGYIWMVTAALAINDLTALRCHEKTDVSRDGEDRG